MTVPPISGEIQYVLPDGRLTYLGISLLQDIAKGVSDGMNAATWGNILGDLLDQLDIATALDGKQPVGDYATGAQGDLADTAVQPSDLSDGLATKQDTLVSGANIKTINGASVLGSGDLVVTPPSTVTARIRRAVNQSIPTGTGWTDIVWDTAAYEANGDFWTSGATVSIPAAGYYQIFVEATFDGTGLLGVAVANMQVLLNGVTVIGEQEAQVMINGKAALDNMSQRLYAAGDTIKVQVKHSDAGAVNVLAQGDHSPDIILTRLA